MHNLQHLTDIRHLILEAVRTKIIDGVNGK